MATQNGQAENPALLRVSPQTSVSEDTRSSEMTEIIGKMPHWLVRRGIVVITLLVAGILTGAYFFKYPDIIPAKVTISSASPPVKLVARSSLPIQSMFVRNDEVVTKDQVLCVFANAARYADILRITDLVKRLDTCMELRAVAAATAFPPNLQLGELQPGYVELYQSVLQYQFFLKHNAYDATIGSLSSQVTYSNELLAEQDNRQHLQQEQIRIQQRQFAADSSLLNARVISRQEYEESQKRMLDQQMTSGSNRTSQLQNRLQQSEYRKNIAVTTLQKQSEENDLLQKVKDAVRRFQGQLAQWEQNYVLRSPIDGRASFFNVWKENQFVTAGDGILMVIPPQQDFMVRGTAGADRYGKIRPGQKVLLKLQSYPYEEYGMLEATLTKNTLVAMDNNYAIELQLKHGLVTSAGKKIPASPQLQADAEIVTSDKNILSRLFEKVIGKVR